ncbi:hypothetical protein STEG23_019131 [Scotinomys teguina]
METQHRINKHLMSGIVAANQRMDLIQTQVEELFGLIQIGCIAKLKHMCVTPLRFDEAGNESRMIASYLAGNWTRDAELLMSQQLLQIAALNETRVEPISLGDFTDWLSSAFSFFKEWVGVGIFGAICCFGVVLCLWFLCRLRARQVRDKAVIIQALAALEHGVSPQVSQLDSIVSHLPALEVCVAPSGTMKDNLGFNNGFLDTILKENANESNQHTVHHYTLTRMARVQNTDNTKSCQGCRTMEPPLIPARNPKLQIQTGARVSCFFPSKRTLTIHTL